MSQPEHGDAPAVLRILYLEDRPADAELTLLELKRDGLRVEADVVSNREAFVARLQAGSYDLVLGDYRLPDWTGLDAFRYLRESGSALPFILVTGTLGDELAAECIRSGITDYVLKERLTRLPIAIRRALEEQRARQERLRLEEQNRLLSSSIQAVANGVVITDPEGTILWTNAAFTWMTGWEAEDVVGKKTNLLKSGAHPPAFFREMWETITAGRVWSGDLINRRKDGSLFDENLTITPVTDNAGRVTHYVGVKKDITERKRLEAERDHLLHILERTLNEVYIFDAETLRFIYLNHEALRNLGYPAEAMSAKTPLDIKPEFDAGSFGRLIQPLREGTQKKIVFQTIHRRADGTDYPVEVHLQLTVFRERPAFVALINDLTETKRASEAVRQTGERFRLVWESATDGMRLTDGRGTVLVANEAYCRMMGKKREEVEGHPLSVVYALADQERILRKHCQRFANRDVPVSMERRMTLCDGRELVLETANQFIEPDSLQPLLLSVFRDITARKRAEEALRQSEQKFRAIFDGAEIGIALCEPDGKIILLNRAYQNLVGLTAKDLPVVVSFDDVTHPDDRQADAEKYQDMLAGKFDSFQQEKRYRLRDGRVVWANLTAHLLKDAENKPQYVLGMAVNITGQKHAEDAVRQSEANYRSLVENSPYGIYRVTEDGTLLTVNSALVQMLGYPSTEELLQTNVNELYERPEERSEILTRFRSQGKLSGEAYVHWKKRDGQPITVRLNGRAVTVGPDQALQIELMAEDVTARQVLETQFRQSQKMEAVGQLAGGVAHDFNNLLGVILGYAELLLEKDPGDEPLQEIRAAAKRGATLTRQLLAFSRQQVLDVKLLNLNHIVRDAHNLLQRLLREDIEFHPRLTPDLWTVKADPGQIDQILMNLTANARDAMPKGGKLTLETANVELDEHFVNRHPIARLGSYVMLAVTDNGIGMDANTLEKIFEPFFTTKDKGKGTGLGLATVYGIVKQSEGFIWAYSEIGHGTTFKIYLPAVRENAVSQQVLLQETAGLDGSETILLVEDVEALRKLTRTILETYGYTVLEAADGVAALELAQRQPGAIHLLLTDVVMPRMGGEELARKLRPKHKGIKLILMTGYSETVVRQRTLGATSEILQKPFTPGELLKRVRKVLDSSINPKRGRKR